MRLLHELKRLPHWLNPVTLFLYYPILLIMGLHPQYKHKVLLWSMTHGLDSWIASEDEHFYRNGIRALPERWEKVVANDGQYFE